MVAAMCKHTGHNYLQWGACRALRNMNVGDGKRNVRAGNVGAVEAVVVAMRTHEESDDVQENACTALFSLTSANAETNRTRAENAGALEAAVAAMCKHTGNKRLQLLACQHCATRTLVAANATFARGPRALSRLWWRRCVRTQVTRLCKPGPASPEEPYETRR